MVEAETGFSTFAESVKISPFNTNWGEETLLISTLSFAVAPVKNKIKNSM
jgi:hypothetical protein